MVALLTSLLISFLLSPWFIKKLKSKQIGQQVRNDGPESHFSKAGTPTMGGGLILFATLVPALLWMNISNPNLWFVFSVTLGYGLIGFYDDFMKVSKKNTKGLSGKGKLLGQFLIAGIACAVHFNLYSNGNIYVPFLKNVSFDLGPWYVLFSTFVIVGSSNAVNLTDGLDGLAIGPVITTSACYSILSYAGGHIGISEYLQIPYVLDSGELTVFCMCLIGAGLGFLWYNSYPAQVFMGDVGSLPLGGAIGAIAVASKNEILLVIVGGIFVVEALSVMTQVASFKLTGKRVFKMAPIHHHYELKGWPEPKVIVRFWIISIILAIVGLMSLKLR